MTERGALKFFIDKIVSQAAEESEPLSDAQRWMLRYSDSDPDFEVDPGKYDAFERETSDEEYEARIAGLLQRRFRRDVAAHPNAAEEYRQAFGVLNQGDYYILSMIATALGGRVQKPSRLGSIAPTILLIVPAVVAIAMGLGVFWYGLTHQRPSPGDFLVTFLGGLVPISLGLYLVRMCRREHGRVE